MVRRRLSVHLVMIGYSERSSKLLEDTALVSRVFGILVDGAGFVEVTPATSTILGLGSRFDLDLVLHVGMLEGDKVLRGCLTRSQTVIVSESMPSTQSIPAIRSLGVGGWVSVNRSVPTDLSRSIGRW
jgi:hypothetical protein